MPPRHACCVLSRLHCNEHSLLLSSHLSRIGRIQNPSCSACRHLSQDIPHLILLCPATAFCAAPSLSLFDLWSRLWRVARLLGLHCLLPCPHPSEGDGQQQQQHINYQQITQRRDMNHIKNNRKISAALTRDWFRNESYLATE